MVEALSGKKSVFGLDHTCQANTPQIIMVYCGEKHYGPSINDVTQMFHILTPPFVAHSLNLSVLFVTKWVIPLPP